MKPKFYKAPFTYDPYSQTIICKSTPNMVAQIDDDSVLLIRGWGGLHTTLGEELGAKVQDAFGRRVCELLNEHGIGNDVEQFFTKEHP